MRREDEERERERLETKALSASLISKLRGIERHRRRRRRRRHRVSITAEERRETPRAILPRAIFVGDALSRANTEEGRRKFGRDGKDIRHRGKEFGILKMPPEGDEEEGEREAAAAAAATLARTKNSFRARGSGETPRRGVAKTRDKLSLESLRRRYHPCCISDKWLLSSISPRRERFGAKSVRKGRVVARG